MAGPTWRILLILHAEYHLHGHIGLRFERGFYFEGLDFNNRNPQFEGF